ncbi:Zn(II)2Cys6 transcription factor [Aspergillus fischeri NRRL 181]|uniref:Fungal specific transcription factor, putative n=1 Tax=Neosartorya fischeri (strain ATCC 1020 / DSM 3700 / CBS 544.65 / FGSC A1164 / JCM 1740 / NRRL 181 / WB 181) TaxID=331117 RepID=A1D0T4_NEOFI|nr:fungal specific transcription factor, putative [Aspergillus fischeri NRRL 181]EAW24604.1 fungal specific transcription factor, putative [Aspergillus fischeri NRRL 181]KAG2002693.1 hypothetical protein GB937_009562 [Aspergillus fischeri]
MSTNTNTNTASHTAKPEKSRLRAAKACRRCSQRKIKCDAVQNGLPCSRCRMDNTDDCTLTLSRRGTYDRNVARDLRLKRQLQSSSAGVPDPSRPSAQGNAAARRTYSEGSRSTVEAPLETTPSPLESGSSRQSIAGSLTGSIGRSKSAMFEEFLRWRDRKIKGRLGLFLLGEPSPLTFALEELPQGSGPQLHDASDQICNSSNLEVIQKDVHPQHLDEADITYLKAKGAFTPPSEKTLDDLVAVYLSRFHPLYSIVNKVELEKVHKEHKLPWILLHAVCFIGATFCEPYILHSAGFLSRSDARRHFYQKAKLLFDASYEANKIILLQVAIMLSFRGPQMQSYWNPCSWVGFGVTFAVSLGLHRSTASSNAPGGDTGLLRRLWWTLVVRDTYCAVLLGRPFRIDLPHSDVEMLTPDDFIYDSHDEAFYQIQMARLSPILRDITHCRSGDRKLYPQVVHAQIEAWRADLEVSLQQWPGGSPSLTWSTALEVIYNYYLLLLYIDKPDVSRQQMFYRQPGSERPSQELVESTARAIASKAITLMTKARLSYLPHEVFPGFFVAGIIHYRQTQQNDPMVAQMARASLDNCRVILNEVKEFWEPGEWAIEIFDFLNMSQQDNSLRNASPSPCQGQANTTTLHTDIPADFLPQEDSGLLNHYIFGSNWETVMQGGLAHSADDSLLMPCFLPSVVDERSFLQP